MTMEELFKDTALQAELAQEIEAKIKEGTAPAEAKAQALKARGIEFDEDALKAEAVERMKLSDEALDNVDGGGTAHSFCVGDDLWCTTLSACFSVMIHASTTYSKKEACWSDYSCVTLYHHDG